MKYLIIILVCIVTILSCKTYQEKQIIRNEAENALVKSDTVRISSAEHDYELIIIDPGFNTWLNSVARPRHYYSQQFLENRNAIYVQAWNQRNLQPNLYDPLLYELRIDYDTRTNYGYEINYKLYNYFIYFQLTYKQRLTPALIPRI